MLDEVLAKQSTLDELNDCCEMLMDMTACNRVRDDTVQVQTKYGKLLSKIQGKIYVKWISIKLLIKNKEIYSILN